MRRLVVASLSVAAGAALCGVLGTTLGTASPPRPTAPTPRVEPARVAAPAAAPVSTPARPSTIERLKELENPKLSPLERSRLGLRLYRDEVVEPTRIPGPPYMDFRTHDYVLAQITGTLAKLEVDPAPLRAAREGEFAPEIKDCLVLYFFLKGEKELKDPVVAYVLDRKHPPRLRELGTRALGEYALKQEDASLGPVLAQIIREDYQGLPRWVRKPKGSDPGQVAYVYPVKRAAVEAIKKLDAANILLDGYVLKAAEQAQVEQVLSPPGKPPAAPPGRSGAGK
jgi:hypothetical protein